MVQQLITLRDIVQHMGGGAEANTKAIHRWLKKGDPNMALMRLYHDETPYMVVDVTEVERAQAKRTGYVGVLKDGKTLGFVLMHDCRGEALAEHGTSAMRSAR